MRYSLILDGKEFKLPGPEVLLGRGAGCSVHLNHESVSRQHAKIVATGAHVSIVDLDSPNGVFVNGERIVNSRSLTSGDVINLGTLELHFVALDDTMDTSPPPDSVNEGEMMHDDGLISQDVTTVNNATALLCTSARHLLETGRPDEAEKMLKHRWHDVSARAHLVHPALTIFAARTGLRVAAATGGQAWLDESVAMLAAAGKAPNVETLSELEKAVDRIGLTSRVRTYLETIVDPETSMDEQARQRVASLLTRT